MKVRFPNRTEAHVKETRSFKVFENSIPDHWIVRHVTERDYGVDCLVEIVIGGQLRGDLIAIQMKSTESLGWPSVNTEDDGDVTFTGIRVETVNYWIGLPVPVFLCVHESNTGRIYFANAKAEVRRRFGLLEKHDTFGFRMSRLLELTDETGPLVLAALALQELQFHGFAAALADLLAHADRYVDYLLVGIGRDYHLSVEPDDMMQLVRLYRSNRSVALSLGMEWNVIDLQALFDNERKLFPKSSAYLHEYSRTRVLEEIAPVFIETIRRAIRLVTVEEAEFWQVKEPFLFFYADSDTVPRRLDDLEDILAPLVKSPNPA